MPEIDCPNKNWPLAAVKVGSCVIYQISAFGNLGGAGSWLGQPGRKFSAQKTAPPTQQPLAWPSPALKLRAARGSSSVPEGLRNIEKWELNISQQEIGTKWIKKADLECKKCEVWKIWSNLSSRQYPQHSMDHDDLADTSILNPACCCDRYKFNTVPKGMIPKMIPKHKGIVQACYLNLHHNISKHVSNSCEFILRSCSCSFC